MHVIDPFFRIVLACCLLVCLVVTHAQAQTGQPDLQPAHIDQFITQLMDSASVPGLSIAIISNDRIVYTQGYGLTKADSTQRVTSATVFDAASLSKPVFAYAVLQLVEQGLIDLDKPLYEYLPYPDAAADERYKRITARMVLSHQSGFPNWRKNRQSAELAMAFTPGERFGYSGEGFVYLQKVVEKITGKPTNVLMTERVFNPLGMTRSSYVWQPAFDADFAFAHDDSGNAEPKHRSDKANVAYSLQTTADDYAKFILAILDSKGLKPATVGQMLSPQSQLPKRFSKNDTLSQHLHWGLGFGLEKTPTGDYFWHWGDNDTYRCYVSANLAQKRAVVYFTNSSHGLSFCNEMTHRFIGGDHLTSAFLGYKSYKDSPKQAPDAPKK